MQEQAAHSADLGSIIRDARQRAGLTLRQLATQSDVGRSTLSRIENGEGLKPTPGTLMRLAQTLEVSASKLFISAGLPIPEDYKTLPAMLRAEYDLPPELVAKIQRDIEQVAKDYHEQTKREEDRNDKRDESTESR